MLSSFNMLNLHLKWCPYPETLAGDKLQSLAPRAQHTDWAQSSPSISCDCSALWLPRLLLGSSTSEGCFESTHLLQVHFQPMVSHDFSSRPPRLQQTLDREDAHIFPSFFIVKHSNKAEHHKNTEIHDTFLQGSLDIKHTFKVSYRL